MFSNSQPDEVASIRKTREPLNLSLRSELTELMDGPCSYGNLCACFRDLEQVNRVTLAYRPTLQWLSRFLGHGSRPLHIVDIGSGGGDVLRRIEQWASKRNLPVRLTGIDLNPAAVQVAREFTPFGSRIRWIAGDAYSLDHISDPVDLVISSLFTHHLSNLEIVRFLEWMERVSRRGWFINDLSRSRLSYAAFQVLARTARWHRFIQNDGPISIRRAFQPAEWKVYAEAAGLPLDLIQIERRWPGRLIVSRRKQL